MAELVVNRPQFDTSILTPGTAVYVRGTGSSDGFYGFDKPCLITTATPLALTVAYVDIPATRKSSIDAFEDEDESLALVNMKYKVIGINLVSGMKVRIRLMAEVKEAATDLQITGKGGFNNDIG